jgi:hypothetical protein
VWNSYGSNRRGGAEVRRQQRRQQASDPEAGNRRSTAAQYCESEDAEKQHPNNVSDTEGVVSGFSLTS